MGTLWVPSLEAQPLPDSTPDGISRKRGGSAKVTGLRLNRGQNQLSEEGLPILKFDPAENRLELQLLCFWSPHGPSGNSMWYLSPVLQVCQALPAQCGTPLTSMWSAPLWSSTMCFWVFSTSLAGHAGWAWRGHLAVSYLGPCSPAACISSEVRNCGRVETQR